MENSNIDKRIGQIGAGVVTLCVAGFALGMLVNQIIVCYLTSIGIAWGLVLMNSAFLRFSRPDAKVAAMAAVAFGAMYALCNTMVYFIQVSTVRNVELTGVALQLLDYRQFGMMFDLDLLGYCLMAVSTFFAGLTILVRDKGDRWLKMLLLLHGVFAIGCFILPMLGLFSTSMQGADWIGTVIMEFWCVFFLPIGILTFRYFTKAKD
ncbi:MAG: hypothetical protein VB091_05415 [Christensenella sp.]|nr:hypothetical protein [Christensenella sp.]